MAATVYSASSLKLDAEQMCSKIKSYDSAHTTIPTLCRMVQSTSASQASRTHTGPQSCGLEGIELMGRTCLFMNQPAE